MKYNDCPTQTPEDGPNKQGSSEIAPPQSHIWRGHGEVGLLSFVSCYRLFAVVTTPPERSCLQAFDCCRYPHFRLATCVSSHILLA